MRILLAAVLLGAVVLAAADLPQPEVEFEDGTTASVVLTKPKAEQELVVLGCGDASQKPRLCGMSATIEANAARGAENAAAISANAAAIVAADGTSAALAAKVADNAAGVASGAAGRESLRTAMLAADASLRSSVTLLRTEMASVKAENKVLREELAKLAARVSAVDHQRSQDVERLEALHADGVGRLQQLERDSADADDRLRDAVDAVRKMEGPKGERGLKGATGDAGAVGAKGEKGDEGEKGTDATNHPTPSPTPSPTPAGIKPVLKSWQRSDKFVFWRDGPPPINRLDFTMAPGYTWGKQSDGAVFDLGAARAAGKQWTLRFRLHLSKYASGSTQTDHFGIGLTSSPAFSDAAVCQSAVSFNVGAGKYGAGFYVHGGGDDAQVPSCGFAGGRDVARFAREPAQGDTLYAELRRDGVAVHGAIYTDNTYTSVSSVVKGNVVGHMGALRYIAVKGLGQTARGYAAGFNFLSGWVDSVTFADGASAT